MTDFKFNQLDRRIAAITALCVNFNRKPTAELFHAYNEVGLNDVPTADLELASAKALRTCKFMPTVADLRELAGYGEPTAAEQSDVAADAAWASVQKAMIHVGYYGSPNFKDRLINAVVRSMGGWPTLCNMRDGEEGYDAREWDTWRKKEFRETYKRTVKAGASDEACRALIGFHDSTNAMNGYSKAIKPPVLIETDQPRKRLPEFAKRLN